jgi:hypothetical protein
MSVIGGIQVRDITVTVTVTCHDGTSYRLATTILDRSAAPPAR